MAATPPTGPVFVALPMDVFDAALTEEVVPTSFPDTRVAPSADAVRAAVAMLAGASRPLIVTGDGIAFSVHQEVPDHDKDAANRRRVAGTRAHC